MIKNLCFTIAAGILLTGCACSTDCCEPEASAANSHFAKFGTNKVHYVVDGKGSDTVVLIHGWSGNLNVWREQVPALAGKARVIRIDLPGHGQSDKPQTAYTMDYFAQGVLAVLKDARVKKATLVGHSMGAPVICRVYKQSPQSVAALVSVDGSLRRPPIPPEQANQFIAGFRSADYRENIRRFVGSMFSAPGTETTRDRIIADSLETPQYVMVSAMEGMFAADQPDWTLQKVGVPVLVINAPNPMWNDDFKAYVNSLSTQSEYRTIEGVGHWLMLEKPSEFNAALTAMLEKFELIDD